VYWSSTAFSVVAYASQRTLSQLWRTATVRCCHKRTYVFLLNSNPNQSVSPDTSRNRKFKIIKKSLWWESYCTIRTDVRSLMVTLRSFFFAKARKVRILVTGKVCSCYGVTLLLSCLFICFFIYAKRLMGCEAKCWDSLVYGSDVCYQLMVPELFTTANAVYLVPISHVHTS
jgi:hypothetical protein